MSSALHLFRSPCGCTAVRLPFTLADVVEDWAGLRTVMARRMPDAFTRDEWAYLISFLDPTNLRRPFEESFGDIDRLEERWLRFELRDLAYDTLTSARATARGLFKADAVKRLLDEHMAVVSPHHDRIWALLMLELWFAMWIDGVAAKP